MQAGAPAEQVRSFNHNARAFAATCRGDCGYDSSNVVRPAVLVGDDCTRISHKHDVAGLPDVRVDWQTNCDRHQRVVLKTDFSGNVGEGHC